MSVLSVRLLGKLDVRHDEGAAVDLQPSKARELFAYLLLYRDRSHPREALASLMWRGSNAGLARKYLRQTLWQLQRALDSADCSGCGDVLLTDPEWIQLNPRAELWLDVAELEQAWSLARETPSQAMDGRQIRIVQEALDLYRGDLLEGCYESWCLFERERLQQLYLALLEKRMVSCEARGEYEVGLACGIRALRCDVAHERTHRHMMRLHYLSGDRTSALRQYERCVAFLREELEVEPALPTVALYERIRSGLPLPPSGATRDGGPTAPDRRLPAPPEALKQLEQLQMAFLELQCQLQETIEMFHMALGKQD